MLNQLCEQLRYLTLRKRHALLLAFAIQCFGNDAAAAESPSIRPVTNTKVALRADLPAPVRDPLGFDVEQSGRRAEDVRDHDTLGNASQVTEVRKLAPASSRLRKPSFAALQNRDKSWWASRVGILFGGFFALVMAQKMLTNSTGKSLPTGAVQVCGKVPLDSKQFLHLVRIGERLLVLLESPQGMQRLAEITDADEVQRLLEPSRRGVKDDKTRRNLKTAPKVSDVLAQFREYEGQLN